jgi:hypothetical protein
MQFVKDGNLGQMTVKYLLMLSAFASGAIIADNSFKMASISDEAVTIIFANSFEYVS